MRRFWGRNDSNQNQYKFSRDDEQIIALNYENLCDSDYLTRLFLQDHANQNKEEIHEGRLTDSPSSHPEISEDIMIFSKSLLLGKYFFKKRLQREIAFTLKSNDALSSQISKQVAVFDHMANLLSEKCKIEFFYQQKNPSSSSSSSSSDEKKGKEKDRTPPKIDPITAVTLKYCFGFIGNNEKEYCKLPFHKIQSIVISLIQYFRVSSSTELLILPQFGELRKLFNHSISRVFSLKFLNQTEWSRKEFEDEIKTVLSSIYGILGIGLLTNNVSDIIVALSYLMFVMIVAEEKVDTYLSRIKELLSSTTAASTVSGNSLTNAATSKNIPNKVQGKLKNAPPKPSPLKSNADTIEDSYDAKLLPPSQFDLREQSLSENPQASGGGNNNSNNNNEVSLKTHGSAAKLWDKSSANKIEPNKGKLNPKGSKEQKMLYEYLDTPKDIALPPANNTVISNHVLVNYNTAPPGSSQSSNSNKRSINNNHDSPNTFTKTKENVQVPALTYINNGLKDTFSEYTPRTNLRKIEKEIKTVYNSIFHVPQLVLNMFGEYCNTICNNNNQNGVATTKLTVPGASTSSKNQKTAVVSSANKAISNKVWSCGQNSYGELGLGDVNVRKSFMRITNLDDKGVVSIGAGNEHSLFVTADGKLYTAGYNDNGQCGVGSTQQVRQPSLVQALDDEEIQQVHVYNGCEHTLALTKDGKLFTFGYNYRGQLGLGSTNSESLPRPVRTLLSKKVVLAACSYHHSVILCSDGSIFSCGRNDSGQLGHGDTVDKKIPHPITSAPRNITSLSCGQFHTVVSTSSGLVFVSGKNDYGQLGLENNTNVKVLTKINVPPEMDNIVQVCCGYYHTLLLSSTGIVGGFGRNDYGQLGMGHAQPKIFQCTIITGLRDKGVTLLAAGCYHSIGVTLNGMLYVFGRNNHGQLATGDLEERHNPHPIDDFIGQKVIAVSAGFYHTLVLTTDSQLSVNDATVHHSPGLNAAANDSLIDHRVHTEVDLKQLATGFKKDLELLCGYEYLEKNESKLADGIGNKQTFDQLSSISCRELITVIIRHVTVFDQKELMSITVDGKRAICTAIQCVTSLLYILWEIMSDPGSFRINLPMSIADAQLLLRKLFPCIGKFLLMNKQGILEILQTEKATSVHRSQTDTEAEVEEEEDLEIALETMEMNYLNSNISNNLAIDHVSRIREYIEALFTSYQHTSDSESGTATSSTPLSTTLQKLRLILLQIYFDPKLLLHYNEEENLSISICEVILSNHEIFFQQPVIYLSLLKYLHHSMMMKNEKFLIDQKLQALYLRLLSCMGKVYHNIDEAIKMFQKSKKCGLQIFHTYLTIYNFYSRYVIERKAITANNNNNNNTANGNTTVSSSTVVSPASGSTNNLHARLLTNGGGGAVGTLHGNSVDIRRVLTVLEQSVNNLIKCGIPLILQCQPQLIEEGIVDSEEILLNMIQDSEKVIDYALQQSFSEETLSQLRYGTQMPSILPSTFLFAIGAAKKGVYMMKLFPYLLSFIHKLQQITKYEIQSHQQKSTVERKNSSENLALGSGKHKEGEGLSANGNTSVSGLKEDDMNESLAEELLYLKKDQSQISWWFRLLKMTVNLICRMKFGHLNRLASLSHSEINPEEVPLSTPISENIRHHRLWYYLEINEEYLRDWKEFSPPLETSMKVSARTNEICKSCREKEKMVDNVYKMLSISTQSNFSGALLQQIEEQLVEMILEIAFPNLPIALVPTKYYSSVFHLATSVTKFIHSRRSQLISNSGSLSWVEILSTLATLTVEFSRMLKASPVIHSLNLLPAFISRNIATSNRARRHWRKAFLVVFTYVRWKKAYKAQYSSFPLLLVDFVSQCISHLTKDFTKISSITTAEVNSSVTAIDSTNLEIQKIYTALLEENNKHSILNDELSSAVSLLDSIYPLSLKSDVIIGLLASFRDKYRLITAAEPIQLITPTPCSLQNAILMKKNIQLLESAMMKIVESPLFLNGNKFHYTMIELQLLSNAIRFLEVLYSSSKIRYNYYRNNSYSFHLPLACKLLLLLFEKYVNWSALGEEKLFNRKLGNLRERNLIAKRTIFILLSYIQAMVMISIERKGDNYHVILNQVIPVYNNIISRLQYLRNEETFNTNDETSSLFMNLSLSTNSTTNNNNSVLMSAGSGKEDANLGSTPSSSSLLLSPTTNSTTVINPMNRIINAANNNGNNSSTTSVGTTASSVASNNAKKRCQDLIIKPLEFSRNSDGIVIQGEKLLNSCKGSDFSIVTWILVTNKSSVQSTNKGNFIVGKIHHNEAWPVVLLKSDHKLEIVYGHNNEYEKATTENTIPLHTWTHLAIVVDQKKIKIFVNGILDLQITTTKGNNKAVTFPLVIGSCPANVRTRVNNVKEGFDGMLAQCKYYSRALSPIHVKVIYDHGPPETTDISAKIIFHLLASLKYMINTVNTSSVGNQLQSTAELCHSIFMTDSNRRNRYAAIQLLTNILQLNTLEDIGLTHLQGSSMQAIYSISVIPLSSLAFAPNTLDSFVSTEGTTVAPSPNSLSFQEKMIWYFLRIAGCNWMQGNIIEQITVHSNNNNNNLPKATEDENNRSPAMKLQDFIPYLPRSCFNKWLVDILQGTHPSSSSNSTAGMNNNNSKVLASQFPERICSQEDPFGEITYQAISVLFALSSDPIWSQAIISLLRKLFVQIIEVISTTAHTMHPLMMIDLIGAVMLLGGVPNGAYLGAFVNSYFDDSTGYIIQINNTVNGATVLSSNLKGMEEDKAMLIDENEEYKTMKVRLNDLQFQDDYSVSSMKEIITQVSPQLVVMLEHYSAFIQLLTKDYTAYYVAESSFQLKSLLKCLRPIESFIFMKLMNAFTHIPETASLALLQAGNRSKVVLADFLFSSIPYQLPVLEPITDFPIGNTASGLITNWFTNIKYISSLPMKWIYHRFPMESEEAYLFDFMHKQIGLNYDPEIRKEFGMNGLLSRVLIASDHNNNNNYLPSLKQQNSPPFTIANAPPVTYAMNDIFMKSIQYLEMTLSEKELANAFFYYQYIRKQMISFVKLLFSNNDNHVEDGKERSIITATSQLLKEIVNTRSTTSISSSSQHIQMMLLVSLGLNPLTSTARCENWSNAFSLQQIYPSTVSKEVIVPAWRMVNQTLLEMNTNSTSSSSDVVMAVMNNLVLAIKYACNSLLQHRHQKSAENILLETDLYDRFLCNLYYWLELDHSFSMVVLEQIVEVIFSELLPLLPMDESEILEFKILQVCVYILRKFSLKLLQGHVKVTRALQEIVKGVPFNELRTRAQEQILKYKGHNMNDISHYAYNITQLVCAMELIQRRCFFAEQMKPLVNNTIPSSSTSTKQASTNLVAKLQTIEIASPKLITVRSNSIDVDLTPCLNSVLSFATSEVLQGLALSSVVLENIIIEVALGISGGVILNNTEFIYETIFCGATTRLVQAGLMPDSVYMLKCRAFLSNHLPFSWSLPIEFHTEKGLLFTFDSLKCGQDVILSEDSLTASYTGDDAWSSLLATRSFSSGVTSWEIRVNQSSTAYLFIGVATSSADLNTFLGGCSNGWGFIGEQAVYHNREKVKVYGETFTTGDIIGVSLDLNMGTLSFSKNKKSLGIAFDKIYGELYPAVAFYNIGQELQIIAESFKTTCSHEPIPISPSRLNMDELSLMNELILCLYARSPISSRVAMMIADHCNQWCNTVYVRCRTVSKKDIFLAVESPLLKRFNLVVGERVRTFYGVAEVAGTAYNRIWFKVNSLGEVWFFSNPQIIEGRAKKLFMRCTYNTPDTTTAITNSTISAVTSATSGISTITTTPSTATNSTSTSATANNASSSNSNNNTNNSLYSITFDSATIMELLDPMKWTKEMDEILLEFLIRQSEIVGIEPWKITSDKLFDNYRSLQQQLSRIILSSGNGTSPDTLLSHHWGIAGPKRKAVIARLGLIRIFNQFLEMYLPFFISDYYRNKFDRNKLPITDDFIPIIETFTEINNAQQMISTMGSSSSGLPSAAYPIVNSAAVALAGSCYWPPTAFSWDTKTQKIATIQEIAYGPLHPLRYLIFRPLKFQHFQEVIKRTSTRPAKTEDDYDYPENLPHVKINRLKALRAREAAELLGLSGEDVLLNTMFCQLWKELKSNTTERLRISYTHPMDDGQSRSFKIKFEAEGVDDYGGPYREIFQQICNELQLLHPSAQAKHFHSHHQENDVSSLSSTAEMIQPGSSLAAAASEPTAPMPVPSFAMASFLPKDPNAPHSTVSSDMQKAKLACFFPLFLPTPNWTNDNSECVEKYRFMFHPDAKSPLKQELFYFTGQLVGIAIRSKITLDLAFPSFIWKSLVGESLTEKDLASFDQSAHDFLLQLQTVYQHYLKRRQQQQQQQQHLQNKEQQEEDAEELKKELLEEYEMIRDLTWTATRSDGQVIELRKNGKQLPLDIADLGEYLTAYLTVRLNENKQSIQMFRNGLLTIVPESAISILSWDELQSIVCGSNSIDIQRLKDNTEYDDDVSPEDTHIIAFWEVLTEFNEIEKSAFLKFVWARPSLPPKDVEFTQKMRILTATTDDNNTIKQDQFLPKAHTCFFSINLPKYSSKKILAEKLRYAIFNCTEMDGDYRTTETDVPGWGVNMNQLETSFQSIDY